MNNKGFQLIKSVDGRTYTEPSINPDLEGWESAVARRPRGYVVEFNIPLDMINTHDTSIESGGTPGFRRREPGDVIGFNVGMGDNDTGGGGYFGPGNRSNSYIAWDGSSLNWVYYKEEDWGRLYLAP